MLHDGVFLLFTSCLQSLLGRQFIYPCVFVPCPGLDKLHVELLNCIFLDWSTTFLEPVQWSFLRKNKVKANTFFRG